MRRLRRFTPIVNPLEDRLPLDGDPSIDVNVDVIIDPNEGLPDVPDEGPDLDSVSGDPVERPAVKPRFDKPILIA